MGKQCGFLMVVVAILLIVIGGLATAFVGMSLSSGNSSVSIIATNSAYDLAKTGIEAGSYQLINSTSWCDGTWQAPVTVAGQGQYQYSCNYYSVNTTNFGALDATQNTIELSSVAGLAPFGAVTINSETMIYDGISGTTLENVKRGQLGTAPANHISAQAAIQNQFNISARGGVPTLTSTNEHGMVLLQQAEIPHFLVEYYMGGHDSSNVGYILNLHGTTWGTPISGPAPFSFRGIYVRSNYGLAVGYDASASTSYMYSFDGVNWTASAPITFTRYTDVSCTLSDCWITGSSDYFFYSLNLGARTNLRHINEGTSTNYMDTSNLIPLTHISCAGNGCVAIESSAAGVSFQFAENSSTPYTSGTLSLPIVNGIGCATANSCLVVQNTFGLGYLQYYNGSIWTISNLLTSNPNAVNAVNCPVSNFCMVVGSSGKTWNCIPGGACTAITPITGTPNLNAVYCASATDCLAVMTGSSNKVYHYNGTIWQPITIPAEYTLNAVSGFLGTRLSYLTYIMMHNH